MAQITTITIFKYTSFSAKLWAFLMMQLAHSHLKKINGLQFYRLWGSGKERFNPLPDWTTYALLQVWYNEEAAEDFFGTAPLMKKYQRHSKEYWCLYLKSLISRGEWSGSNPFKKSGDIDENNPFVVAITRATIKTKLLYTFWKYVPVSQEQLLTNKGLIYTKGFGEVPVKQMATFSVWKSKAALDSFAYQSRAHVKAIGHTRELKWYKEELFSRFQPYRSIGSWGGKNPLPNLRNGEQIEE